MEDCAAATAAGFASAVFESVGLESGGWVLPVGVGEELGACEFEAVGLDPVWLGALWFGLVELGFVGDGAVFSELKIRAVLSEVVPMAVRSLPAHRWRCCYAASGVAARRWGRVLLALFPP